MWPPQRITLSLKVSLAAGGIGILLYRQVLHRYIDHLVTEAQLYQERAEALLDLVDLQEYIFEHYTGLTWKEALTLLRESEMAPFLINAEAAFGDANLATHLLMNWSPDQLFAAHSSLLNAHSTTLLALSRTEIALHPIAQLLVGSAVGYGAYRISHAAK